EMARSMVCGVRMVQDVGMRALLHVALASAALTACSAPVGEDPRMPAPPPLRVETSAEPEVARAPAPPARPRLSRTITLGQGAEPAYTPHSPPRAQAASGPSSNVVVNNTVILQGVPSYGYGYGVGYGVPGGR